MKNKKWEIIAMMLIAFFIFWSIYIHYNDVESLTEKDDKKYTGVIKLWDYPRLNVETGSRYSWIQQKIKSFEKKNPGVYIDFTPLDWESGPYIINQAIESGDKPDIVPISHDFYNFDKLHPLDEYFTDKELDRFKFETVKSVTNDGSMMGVPFAITTYTMYLNLDLFNERGISPPIDGNWTYEEFVESMSGLTFDSDEDGINDHFGFISFIEPNYYNLWGIILSDGANIIDDKSGKFVFKGESAVTGLQKVVDLKYKYGVTPEYFGIIGERECWDMFSKEKKVAVYPTGAWAVKVLRKLQDEGNGFNFDVANFPIGDVKFPVTLSNGIAAFGVFQDEDIKKMEMCVEFLKYLTEDSTQRTLEQLGMFTVKKGIDDMYITEPMMKKIENTIYYTKVVPRDSSWKDIDIIIQEEVRNAILGEKTPKSAILDGVKRVELLTE